MSAGFFKRGGLYLPGTMTSGIINWPTCIKCQKVVDAYGKDDETPKYIDVWARHHGQRDGVRILKGPYYGKHSFGEVMRLAQFFSTVSMGGEQTRTVKVGFGDTLIKVVA